jgi:hypothetical protein
LLSKNIVFINLINASTLTLRELKKILPKSSIQKEEFNQIYKKYDSYIAEHVNNYINNISDISLKKELYSELVSGIQQFIYDIEALLPASKKEIFNNNLIKPLKSLSEYYKDYWTIPNKYKHKVVFY